MKKTESFTKVLSRKEMKDIKGGQSLTLATVLHCKNGYDLTVVCPPGTHAVIDVIDQDIKCCSYTIDSCTTYFCPKVIGPGGGTA